MQVAACQPVASHCIISPIAEINQRVRLVRRIHVARRNRSIAISRFGCATWLSGRASSTPLGICSVNLLRVSLRRAVILVRAIDLICAISGDSCILGLADVTAALTRVKRLRFPIWNQPIAAIRDET